MIIGIDASRANKPIKTGVEWYAYFIIEELKKLDRLNQYRLYTRDALIGDLAVCPSNFQETRLSWPLPYFWTQGRLSWEMKRRSPDVLFVPAHVLPPVCPRRAVVMIHDIGFIKHPEFYPLSQRYYHQYATRLDIKKASLIIVPSLFTKQELGDYYQIPAEKIKVIHHGFNPAFHQPTDNLGVKAWRAKNHLDNPYFLFIGRLEKKKNVLRLVKAFRLLLESHPDSRLVLAGALGNYGSEVVDYLQANQLLDNVLITGWLPTAELNHALSGAEALVFPSLYEGFGLPVLEAQAAGVPVLCSRVASLPEVAGEGALYFNPQSVEEIALAMRKILEDKELRQKLIVAGQANVQRFNWATAAQETLSALLNS